MARERRGSRAEVEYPGRPVIDAFFAAACEHRTAELGRDDVLVAGEDDRIVVGLYLPQISLRFLLCNDVFALQRMTELYGRSESCKTAFLFELYRWHVVGTSKFCDPLGQPYHGGFCHQLAELRDSVDLRDSIIGGGISRRFPAERALYCESWQAGCTGHVKRAHSFFPAGEMQVPFGIGVDSMTAVETMNESEKVWDQGYAMPAFANIAKSINQWAKVFFPRLNKWPLSFIGVNHMKEKKAPNGSIDRTVPGGDALNFASTLKLRFIHRGDIERIGVCGRELDIIADKNSLSRAGNRRKIKVQMLWVLDEQGKQTTWWDWDAATVELLLSFEGGSRKKIDNIVLLENVDKTRRTVTAKQFNLKKAPFTEVGAAISADIPTVQALDQVFGTCYRTPFRMGVPFNVQLSEARALGFDHRTNDGLVVAATEMSNAPGAAEE